MGHYDWGGNYWTTDDFDYAYADDQESVREYPGGERYYNELLAEGWEDIFLAKKERAESSYARAMQLKEDGYLHLAREVGARAIRIYKQLNIQTLEDAAPTRMRVNGIELPDIMH